MTKVLVTEQHLMDIASAIRDKLDSEDSYRPGDMAAAIRQIDGYPEPTGTITISQNGTVNVKDYETAVVNVAGGQDMYLGIFWGSEFSGKTYTVSGGGISPYTGTVPANLYTVISVDAIETPYTVVCDGITRIFTTGTMYGLYPVYFKNATDYNPAAAIHNGIYRGKYLGDHVTPEQYAAIAAGTFDDIYIGDYWIINGITWRVAAFDYWLNTGDIICTAHHVVIVPDTALHNAKMNNSNTTTGGYVGSNFYTGANSNTGKSDAITKISAAFGAAHILSHRVLLTNSVSSGKASGWAWYDSTVDLMNETMVYGANAWNSSPGFEVGTNTSQLPLFCLGHSRTFNGGNWWLSGIAGSPYFTFVGSDGSPHSNNATESYGVRPVFAIK